MQTVPVNTLALLTLLTTATLASGQTLRQEAGVYRDNRGEEVSRLGADLSVAASSPSVPMSATLGAVRLVRRGASEEGVALQGTQLRAGLSQTLDRLTELRQAATWIEDGEARTSMLGVGVSQWVRRETIRLALDLTRTRTNQPFAEILDRDNEVIAIPALVNSVGATVSMRYLATPRWTMDYSVAHQQATNRPPQWGGALASRYFVPSLATGVHAGLARIINRGVISLDSTYGEVSAWQWDLAVLPDLWSGGRGRIAYRAYVEDERTRAYGDELVLGSDTFSAHVAQRFGPKDMLTVAGGATHYRTNTARRGNSYDLTLEARL